METVAGDKTLTIAGEKTETAYDVRDRLQAQERSISAEITELNSSLEQARHANDEKAAYKLLQTLKSARGERTGDKPTPSLNPKAGLCSSKRIVVTS